MVEVIGEPIVLIREFKNLEDFNLYYATHKDDFKNKKSHRLNKEYKIDGYKISSSKCNVADGEIKLIKNKDKNKFSSQSQRIHELEEKIKILSESIAQIIDTINDISNS